MQRTRLITALIIIPLLVMYIMFLPPLYFVVLMMVASIVGLAEF